MVRCDCTLSKHCSASVGARPTALLGLIEMPFRVAALMKHGLTV